MREKLSHFLYNKEKKHTRKYRKKIKRELKEKRNRNKKLIQKYPWLRVVDYKCWAYSDKPIFLDDPVYISLWDDVPEGWITAFGHMMCNEIEEALEKDNLQNKVYVEQAKEKYGGLRLYMTGNKEVFDIIGIYERISEHICCYCGKPHSPMLQLGWISPYCEKCFNKHIAKHYTKTYEEFTPKDKEQWEIPNELIWTRFSKDGDTKKVIDISERVRNIERLWNKRHPEDMV